MKRTLPSSAARTAAPCITRLRTGCLPNPFHGSPPADMSRLRDVDSDTGNELVRVEGFSSFTRRSPESNIVDTGPCPSSPSAPSSQSDSLCQVFRSCVREQDCEYPPHLCPGRMYASGDTTHGPHCAAFTTLWTSGRDDFVRAITWPVAPHTSSMVPCPYAAGARRYRLSLLTRTG